MNISPEERKQFEELIAGLELDISVDIEGKANDLGQRLQPEMDPSKADMSLRRRPLESPVGLVITAELANSSPPIWRKIAIRSDVTLMDVHHILQAAFGWEDRHLFQFSFEPPLTQGSEHFLCPWEVTEGEPGIASFLVRLDEVLQEPGDVLHYVYDYGDNWDLVLTVEELVTEPNSYRKEIDFANLIAGERAAPPEDCGGLRTGQDLREVIAQPWQFDMGAVSRAVSNVAPLPSIDTYFSPAIDGLGPEGPPPKLTELIEEFGPFKEALSSPSAQVQMEVIGRLGHVLEEYAEPSERELTKALSLISWALENLHGVKLTQSGYLPPKLVRALLEQTDYPFLKPTMRESDHFPALEFRTALVRLGLLRKYRGELVRTNLGTQALESIDSLWRVLVQQMRPKNNGTFEDAVAAFFLLSTASSGGKYDLGAVARMVMASGWSGGDDDKIDRYQVGHAQNGVGQLFWFVAAPEAREWFADYASTVAVALAKAVLRGI